MPERLRNGDHSLGLMDRDSVCPIIVADVAFFAKAVQFSYLRGSPTQSELEGLNGSVMVGLARRSEPLRGSSCGGKWKGGVVRDVELPIGT
jgi:hypothetical protein